MPPEFRARIEASRPQLYAMARDQYGLELNSGPFGIDSRPAHVGAKFAESQGQGQGAAYTDAVFRAYWQQARDIGDRAELSAIAASVGLDATAFAAALDAAELTEAVLRDEAEAQFHGLNGVPAIVFAEKYLVSGAQPYSVLENVLAQVRGEADGQ
jgi:predicted DsbA family dithiol-disulfide isomerase